MITLYYHTISICIVSLFVILYSHTISICIIFCRLQGQTDQEAHVPRIQVGKIGNSNYFFKPSAKYSNKKILLPTL